MYYIHVCVSNKKVGVQISTCKQELDINVENTQMSKHKYLCYPYKAMSTIVIISRFQT